MAIWTEELLGRLRNLSSAAAPQKILRLKWEAESSKMHLTLHKETLSYYLLLSPSKKPGLEFLQSAQEGMLKLVKNKHAVFSETRLDQVLTYFSSFKIIHINQICHLLKLQSSS